MQQNLYESIYETTVFLLYSFTSPSFLIFPILLVSLYYLKFMQSFSFCPFISTDIFISLSYSIFHFIVLDLFHFCGKSMHFPLFDYFFFNFFTSFIYQLIYSFVCCPLHFPQPQFIYPQPFIFASLDQFLPHCTND